MEHRQGWLIGVTIGCLLIAGLGRAEAKDKHFHANFAGITTNKDDFSFTGASGGFYIPIAGKSTLGWYTAQLEGEAPSDGQTCALPDGGSGVEFVFVGEIGVLSFAATGEQLFLTLSPSVTSHYCLDATTGVGISGQVTFDVSGGTGRFAGATGSIVKSWDPVHYMGPSTSRGFVANITGTFDGTIELAK